MEGNNNKNFKGAHKKNLIISGALIVLVLAGLFVIPNLKGGTKEEPSSSEEIQEITATTPVALSRAEAAAKYAQATIRFSGDCIAAPERFVTTPGVTVMIDNDTNARRTIMVGQKSYSVGAHRYTLSSMNMGYGEHPVTCDGAPVATIVINKE